MGDDLLQLATSLFWYFAIQSPNKLMMKNYYVSLQLKLKKKMNVAQNFIIVLNTDYRGLW
jgi:hypothetical protein